MPVILTTEEGLDVWLQVPWSEARGLRLPLKDGTLTVAARSERQGVSPVMSLSIVRLCFMIIWRRSIKGLLRGRIWK
ncbi:hypothetical protein ASD79_21215 [Caulobacter sp. Root655]|nr:hypothetical protein ASD79_21215 [Caulobacter sp. Root655]